MKPKSGFPITWSKDKKGTSRTQTFSHFTTTAGSPPRRDLVLVRGRKDRITTSLRVAGKNRDRVWRVRRCRILKQSPSKCSLSPSVCLSPPPTTLFPAAYIRCPGRARKLRGMIDPFPLFRGDMELDHSIFRVVERRREKGRVMAISRVLLPCLSLSLLEFSSRYPPISIRNFAGSGKKIINYWWREMGATFFSFV